MDDHRAGPGEDATVRDLGITVTSTRQRWAWLDRVLPPSERVRHGLWSIPTPFPGSPLRYVLSYAIEFGGGVALVDTGWPCEEAWDGLVTGLRGAWWGISDVKAVLITHGRGDHKGLAKRVREQSGAWVAMHEADVVTPDQFADQVSFRQASDEWLGRRGSQPADFRAVYEGRNETAPDSFDEFMLQPDRLLVDGERPLGPGTSLVSVWTPGHTPGHVCFADRDRGVLLTGDHILPRITPNISPSPFETGNVLGQYLDSLAVTPDLPRAEVLPAHEPVHRAGRPGPRPPQAPREAAGRGNDRAAGPAGQHHRPGDRDASVEQALGADAGPAAAVLDRRSLRSPRPPGPDWLPNQLGNRRRCLAPAPCGRAQAGLTYEHRGASPSGRSTD